MACRVGVLEGEKLLLYSFPTPHPLNSERVRKFWEDLDKRRLQTKRIKPQMADKEVTGLFHSKEHIRYVELSSRFGYGALDLGDTPAFKGVFEAAQYVVGSTVLAIEKVMAKGVQHAFNPVGGLHHATRDSSAGFCVFNDVGVAIELLRSRHGLRRILYVDIDVHHGDGVYYAYEADPDLFIFDVHEDGRYLYPGTGSASESGAGKAKGTKVNVPLAPGSGDKAILDQLPRLEQFTRAADPEFIIFQCGADGLSGDPIGGLRYSPKAHGEVGMLLHRLSHELCSGRLVALGGGGYLPQNCADAWSEVVNAMVNAPEAA